MSRIINAKLGSKSDSAESRSVDHTNAFRVYAKWLLGWLRSGVGCLNQHLTAA